MKRLAPIVVMMMLTSAARADAPTVVLTKLAHGDYDNPSGWFTRDGKTYYVYLNGQIMRGAVGGDGTTTQVETIESPAYLIPLGVSPDGAQVGYGEINQIVMLDVATGAATRVDAWPSGSTGAIQWLTPRKLLSINRGGSDTASAITDLDTKVSQKLCLKQKVKSTVEAWAAPDGKRLAVVIDGTVMWTDLACKAVTKQPGWKGRVERVTISPNSGWIAADVDGGAGTGARVHVARVGTKPKVVVSAKGRTSRSPHWLSNELLLFTDTGVVGPNSPDHGAGLMMFNVKTSAIERVSLPTGCSDPWVLSVAAGGGHAMLSVRCDGAHKIAILSATVAAKPR